MNKWTKRICLFLGLLFLLLIVGVYIEWTMTVNAGIARLAKIRAKLDADEPGWQLDEWNERRNAKLPADDHNVAVLAKKLADQYPKEIKVFDDWKVARNINPQMDLKPNQLTTPKVLTSVREQFDAIKPLIVQMQQVRQYPTGGFKIVYPDRNILSAEVVDSQTIRTAANQLAWQVYLSSQENDPKSAIDACLTIIHLRHVIGDEPTFDSQLCRYFFVVNTIYNTERILGRTEPKTGLAELQAEFEKVLQEKEFVSAMEGQRAIADRMFENIASGTLTTVELSGFPNQGGLDERICEKFYTRYLHDNQAQVLEQITAYRDAAKLKGKERADALKIIPRSKKGSIANIYVDFVMDNIERLMDLNILMEAKLSTAIVAVACERYRQVNGKWPEKLSDIPKEILKEIPLDPYVGGPVKYKRNKTGIVVYATGKDEIDDGGVTFDYLGEKPNTDIGIQLFDPAYRRLPAEVKPKALDDGPPPLP